VIDRPSLLLARLGVDTDSSPLILFGQVFAGSIGGLKEAGAAPPFLHTTSLLPLTLVGVEEQACTTRPSHQQQAVGHSWGAASCRSRAPLSAVAAARVQARF